MSLLDQLPGWARGDWRTMLLAFMGAPNTADNVTAITAWQKSEGPPTLAKNNPLAISVTMGLGTQDGSGDPSFPDMATGCKANAEFMIRYGYNPVLAAFRGNKGLGAIYAAINASGWCRGCQGGHYPEILYEVIQGAKIAIPAVGQATQQIEAVLAPAPPDHNHDYSSKVRESGRRASVHGQDLARVHQGYSSHHTRAPHIR